MLRPLNPPIRDWHDKRVWLLGASSGIGAALARELLARGARVGLSARRASRLQEIAADAGADLSTGADAGAGAGAGADDDRALVLPLDIGDAQGVAAAHQALVDRWGAIDLTIVLAATYRPMGTDDFDLCTAHQTLRVNLEGVYNLLGTLLPELRRRRDGALAIVSSVAGYRGLPRSPVYGPTKAALNNLAESLYLELRPLGIGVFLVNPGFVSTELTELNDFRMPAMITPEQAANRIVEGFARGRFETHFPLRFTMLMKALAMLPTRLYFRLVGRMTGARPVDPDQDDTR